MWKTSLECKVRVLIKDILVGYPQMLTSYSMNDQGYRFSLNFCTKHVSA